MICPIAEKYAKFRPQGGDAKIVERLEDYVVARVENRLFSMVLEGITEVRKITVTKFKEDGSTDIEVIFRKNIDYRRLFEEEGKLFFELLDTPPEFEQGTDREKVRKYLMLKESVATYLVPLILYYFENVWGIRVMSLIVRDLAAGVPAYKQGLLGGRDIDYFIAVDAPEQEIKKIRKKAEELEKYLDYLLGCAITGYMLKEKMVFGLGNYEWKYGDRTRDVEEARPFNEIIGHNLVELHVVNLKEAEQMLKIREPDIKVLDVEKYRKKLKRIKSSPYSREFRKSCPCKLP